MQDDTHSYLTGILLDERIELTLVEVSRACAVEAGSILELVEEGILEPSRGARDDCRFTGAQLRRARLALRLHGDLGIDLAGVALALQLLEEIEALRARLGRRAAP